MKKLVKPVSLGAKLKESCDKPKNVNFFKNSNLNKLQNLNFPKTNFKKIFKKKNKNTIVSVKNII